MADTLPEDAWVNCFLPTPPRPLLTALQKRLHSSTNHLNALAEIYKQRAQIEATYADSLSKLAKTADQGGLSGKSGNDWDRSAGEGKLWESVMTELSETSASHSTLSAMLRTDFEQPLRDLPSKVVAWRRIHEQESSLDKNLKEYEKTSAKLEKAASKSKSSKADQLQSELNQLTSSLSSLSPMVYSTYQRLDEERLRTLKEVIVRWGTVKGDIATRDGQRAEALIATLLSWETGDEVMKAPPVDDEGFSVAPQDRHRSPWDEPDDTISTPTMQPSNLASASVPPPSAGFGQTFSASPSASQENLSSTQPKLNLALAPAPIQESEEERQAALQRMQQTLQMPSQPSRRSTIARGRRDVRNTMFPGSLTEDSAAGLSGLTLNRVAEPEERLADSPTSFGGGVNGFERPQSVARQASMSSVNSNNPFDSPGLGAALTQPTLPVQSSDPGLRASLSETVNVILRGKEVQRIQITGEIHLALRPSASQSTSGPIHIRLTSFEKLEKIAPNPAYLAQVPDRPGEYFLNSEVLANATARSGAGAGSNDKGTLLFKYVVHVQPGKEGASAPLIFDPAFLCKDGETRMILNYRLNDQLAHLSELSNLSFAATFGPGAGVTNVQAKPAGGVWSPSTRKMQWKLDTVRATAEGGKIIAKFTTEPGQGAMTPVNVQATFGSEGSVLSGLGVEVVGGELEGHSWRFDEVKKGTLAGKYLAEPSVQ
ncbi:hypothetical protein IAU60_000539 [Kwoniella sp. DSM 27419]